MRLIIINKRTMMIILLILLVIFGVIIFSIFRLNSKPVFKEEIYYKGTVEGEQIAFVCNIDWGEEYIPQMLKIFKDNNIKISFFPTGRWADKNPELVKTIYDNGHEIGNHGYNHLDYSKLTYDKNKEEILKAHKSIESIIGVSPKFFGPPSGAFNENTIHAAKDLNYNVVLWSIDTIDWRNDSTSSIIYKRVTEKAHNSAIVLMHPKKATVEALPEIIKYLFQKGYKIGTISDVIN